VDFLYLILTPGAISICACQLDFWADLSFCGVWHRSWTFRGHFPRSVDILQKTFIG
jgi:hypothetical protein